MRIILLQLITCVFSIAADPSRENEGSGGAGEARRGGVHQRLPGEPCQRPAQPVPSVIHTPSDPSSRACASSQYCSLSFDRVRGVLVSHLHACVSPLHFVHACGCLVPNVVM
jgi:hypothetical protein